MKMKKIIIALLAVLMILACLPVSAAERELTFERAVQINDTQLVLEFSEPVAINLHNSNYGPYIVIRLVNSAGGTTRFDRADVMHPQFNTHLQWTGSLQYLDEEHDRLLWTITGTTVGVTTITDIVNYSGELADYTDRRVAIAIEEVPFDQTTVTANNAIDNITTEDGEVYLTPTYPSGWERVVAPFEVNFSYPTDLSDVQPIGQTKQDAFTEDILGHGEYVEPEPEEIPVTRVLKNNTMIVVAILGGCVLLSVLMIVISLVVRKKRRA